MQGYNIGYYIRRIRKERGICQEVLYEGLCSRSTLHRIESGEQQPGLFVASQLLQRLVLPRRATTCTCGGASLPAKEYELEGRTYVRPEADAVARQATALELGTPALRFGRK